MTDSVSLEQQSTAKPVSPTSVLVIRNFRLLWLGEGISLLGEAGNKALTIKDFPHASHTIRVGETFASGYFDLMLDWLSKLPFK